MQAVFRRSLEYARRSGYMKKHKLRAVLDTTYILGRGAVKDTYNLLADSMVQLLRVLAEVAGSEVALQAAKQGYEGYLMSSIKREAEVDWDDERSRSEFLRGIVRDGDRLLGLATVPVANGRHSGPFDPRRHQNGTDALQGYRSHSFFAPISALVDSIWGHLSHLRFTLASVGLQEPAFRLSF